MLLGHLILRRKPRAAKKQFLKYLRGHALCICVARSLDKVRLNFSHVFMHGSADFVFRRGRQCSQSRNRETEPASHWEQIEWQAYARIVRGNILVEHVTSISGCGVPYSAVSINTAHTHMTRMSATLEAKISLPRIILYRTSVENCSMRSSVDRAERCTL